MPNLTTDIFEGSSESVAAKLDELVPMERERFNFGTAQAKLPVGGTDPNYHYHWANDTPGRIQLFQAAGYLFVRKGEITLQPGVTPRDGDLGDQVSAIVGRNEDGTPLRAFLMKKLLVHYMADQRKGQERPDAIDAAIRAGKTTQDTNNRAFYIPTDAPIRMRAEVGRPKSDES